jgi:O-glycosyl hydrolase
VQYLHKYAEAGVHYDYIGFLNEPEENVTYTSMLSNGQQAADFIEVFGPILKKSGYKTKLACCDNDGWENSRRMVEQMENATGDAAGAYTKWVDLVTSHGYSSPPTTPLPTQGKKVWETEWVSLNLDC